MRFNTEKLLGFLATVFVLTLIGEWTHIITFSTYPFKAVVLGIIGAVLTVGIWQNSQRAPLTLIGFLFVYVVFSTSLLFQDLGIARNYPWLNFLTIGTAFILLWAIVNHRKPSSVEHRRKLNATDNQKQVRHKLNK